MLFMSIVSRMAGDVCVLGIRTHSCACVTYITSASTDDRCDQEPNCWLGMAHVLRPICASLLANTFSNALPSTNSREMGHMLLGSDVFVRLGLGIGTYLARFQ